MISYKIDGLGIHQITVPTPFQVGPVNFIIVEQQNGLTLFDAGVDTDEAWNMLLQSLAQLGYSLDNLQNIVLTHHHLDHIGLINRILKHRHIPVFAHPHALPRLTRDQKFILGRIEFFKQLYHEMGCGKTAERFLEQMKANMHVNRNLKIESDIIPIEEGSAIPGLDNLELMFTPGHAVDHLVFYDRQRELLIAGDHILPNILSNALVEPGPDGKRLLSLVSYRQSLMKCRNLKANLIFPGHGEPFHNLPEVIDEKLSRIEEKAERITSRALHGYKTAFELCKEIYPTRYEKLFTLIMSETVGLLDYLELSGRIRKELRNDVWYYSSQV
jgi:glyoxylase-like metal-dependent hydrolase (beta-lactamase superfamily II)